MKKPLHVVAFDVPYPPDYGGAIAVFNEIKALHERGERIVLHCFEYGRGQQDELLKYCDRVFYYKRRLNLFLLLRGVPYIVASRANRQLLKNINNTPGTVLLHGIHCTWFVYNGKWKNVLVRLHNVEYIYYRQLAFSSRNILKSLYYFTESFLLRRYEKKFAAFASFATLARSDAQKYRLWFGAKKVSYLPPFVNSAQIESLAGRGDYGLYQGNLAVPENERAVFFLLNKVFGKLPFHFIIAGKNPSSAMKRKIAAYANVTLLENLSGQKMQDLIRLAHIHYVHSINTTGIKIKLLDALFTGRFIIANKNAVSGSGLEKLCRVAESVTEYLNISNELFLKDFDSHEIQRRQQVLQEEFDHNKNTEELLKKLDQGMRI